MELEDIPPAWREALAPTVESAPVRALADFLRGEEDRGARVLPPRAQRFRALSLTPPHTVKAVIVGQDPYHSAGQAHGLAFSVGEGVRVPPSLRNIFREIERDCGVAAPAHGTLDRWAAQGVLLVNTCFSVAEGQAGSHRGRGWEALSEAVLRTVAAGADPVAFLLWGAPAQAAAARVPEIGDGRHLVLTAPHPSPLSAYRGFLGCGHFGAVNRWLEAQGREPIAW